MMQLHRGLVEIYEGLRRYPIVYYYHHSRAYRSLPYTFRMIGGMAGALRWGLPKGHPGSQTPWLPTLITGQGTSSSTSRGASSPSAWKSRPTRSRSSLRSRPRRGKKPSDPWLCRFLQINSFMHDSPPRRPFRSERCLRPLRGMAPFPTALLRSVGKGPRYAHDELAHGPARGSSSQL